MVGQIFFNSGDQGRQARETAPAKTLLAEFTKPAFNQIRPRAGRRRKVQMKSRMPLEPGYHPGMFMRPIIIHDQVEIEFERGLGVDFLKEADELLMPMARHAISDHPAVEHAQGGKQSRRSMTHIIMRHCSTATFLQGQTGLASVQSLDLAFLIHAQNQRLVRRIQIKPETLSSPRQSSTRFCIIRE